MISHTSHCPFKPEERRVPGIIEDFRALIARKGISESYSAAVQKRLVLYVFTVQFIPSKDIAKWLILISNETGTMTYKGSAHQRE